MVNKPRRVREKVGTAIKTRGAGTLTNLNYDSNVAKKLDELPSNTKVELIALREPERRVALPEGAVWVENHRFSNKPVYNLFFPGYGVVAEVWQKISDKKWRWSVTECSDYLTDCGDMKSAQQAAIEVLANRGLHGVKWEKVEPKYVLYHVSWEQKDGMNGITFRQSRYEHAVRRFNQEKQIMPTTILCGQTADGQWHEINRWPKESEVNNGK